MKVDIRYQNPDRKANDEKAIQDTKEYLGSNVKAWELLLVECGRAEQVGTADAFQSINYALAFGGIEGFPVHAIGRTYCPAAYKSWMTEGGVDLDPEGFPIYTEEAKTNG